MLINRLLLDKKYLTSSTTTKLMYSLFYASKTPGTSTCGFLLQMFNYSSVANEILHDVFIFRLSPPGSRKLFDNFAKSWP